MPKQVFLARLTSWWPVLTLLKSQKCLENRMFCNQKWVKNVFFQKIIPRPFGVHKQVK